MSKEPPFKTDMIGVCWWCGGGLRPDCCDHGGEDTMYIAGHSLDGQEERQRAVDLWQILDDIDTLSDMLKEPPTKFQRMTLRLCEARHKYLESDGYTLYTPGQALAGKGCEESPTPRVIPRTRS